VPAPEVVWSSVEQIGAVRLVPTAEPVAMEFVAEVVRIHGCVVDLSTQAVFGPGSRAAIDVSCLHPRALALDRDPEPTAYVGTGLLAPLGGAVNEFYTVLETCAGLYVADRAGVLAGAELVGSLPAGSSALLDEALALFGCAARPTYDSAVFVRVGTLYVPRFWVRPADSSDGHLEAPRWAAAGFSRDFLVDLRTRVLPVPAPAPGLVAVDLGDPRGDVPADVVAAADERGAVVWPDVSALGLAGRAAAYAGLQGLVAVHGEPNVNVIFLPETAHVDEVFREGETPGQFAVLADLRGLTYAATVVPTAEPVRSASLVRTLLGRHPTALTAHPPVYVLTGVWDNADLLDDWLEHQRLLGVAGVLAMDFGSTDGSVEILTSPRWSSFVTTTPFPGITPNHSRILIEVARGLWPRGWALMIDPDEFLVTTTGRIDDPLVVGAMATGPAIEIARYEMTTVRSAASDLAAGPAAADLTLRLTARDQGKVAIDLASDVVPSRSTHLSRGAVSVDVGGTAACLLHAPVRSFERFAQKVDHAAYTLSESPFLEEAHAWHWRRWIRIRDAGGLPDEYDAQFVPDGDLDALLADGVYERDHRLSRAIAVARAAAPDHR
jgi:hypothetical protein